MTELLAALGSLPLAAGLRGSVWAYPLVNAAHIVGVALLFGAIVPLDLRLAGAFRWIDIDSLARVLVPVSVAGLVLTVTAGSLLFITDATDYFASNLFRAKLVVILLALANAALLRLRPAWRAARRGCDIEPGAGLRLAGIASAILWLAAIVLGRLVGYF